MGRHGIEQMNENGERFAELCANNKFVIGGSIDAHKRIHKATWVSPDHKQGQRKAWHIPSPKIGPDDLENQKGSRFS
jgi:hypothetical protein